MMGANYQRMPPALPPEIIDQIWCEIIPGEESAGVRTAFIKGDALPSDQLKRDFAQAAMEYPHFATIPDIQQALGISVWSAMKITQDVKRKARETRR